MSEKTRPLSAHSSIPSSPAPTFHSEPRIDQAHLVHPEQVPALALEGDDQPPAYGDIFGHIENEQDDLGTRANVAGLSRCSHRHLPY